jgi:hypothetical protein
MPPAVLKREQHNHRRQRRPIIMPAIIAVALLAIVIAIVALTILSFTVHVLFSPWLLLAVVAILVWMKFGPRRSRQ